jgi:tRNA pseudouridine(55) synthase
MSKKREERKIKRIKQEKKEEYKKFSKVFYLDKKVGETPLEILEDFQRTNTFLKWQEEAIDICDKRFIKKKACSKIPLAYAGRLDPMAEGKMLILAGEACKERQKYLSLDKEYIFEVLLGFGSDSSDILGLVNGDRDYLDAFKNNDPINLNIIKVQTKKLLKSLKGKREMFYPAFSSKAVLGKPLFLWALEKRLDEIEIPKKEVEIYSIKLIETKYINKEEIKKTVFEKIQSLKTVDMESKKIGEDFRREKVLKSWEKSLNEFPKEQKFVLLKIKTTVSSGTYMRNLAKEIGKSLGTEALAYSIKRTKIGKVKKIFSFRFWINIL